MLFEYFSVIFGLLKITFFKIVYFSRISFSSLPKVNLSLKVAIKKNSKLSVGKKIRCRNNVSFRIYNQGQVTIGDNCFFNDGCSINCQKKIVIGNNVICGQNVMFFDHDHNYKENIDEFVCENIEIGDNVWIGANVVILKGVYIGNNAVIGAGTIVSKNVKPNSIIYQKLMTTEKEIRSGDNI